MAPLRRFTADDIGVLRQMAESGSDGRAIGAALNRTPQAIRTKAVELGITLRPPSLDARRFKLKLGIWAVLESEARRFNTTPSRLARLIVETVIADDLIEAVLDGLPRSLRPAQKRDRRWEIALASQRRLRVETPP